MKLKYSLTLFIMFYILVLAVTSVTATAAQLAHPSQGGGLSPSDALPWAVLTDPDTTPSAASVQRVSTVEVQPYLPFASATAHIQEAYSGAMGTLFTFDVGSFGLEYISNLTYTANNGVTCQHDANLLITCTGPLSQVTIDFDFTYIASDYEAGYTWWGYTGYSNYDLEYTFNLIFPTPLVYVKPYSLEPISITANQITWYQACTRSLPGAALFYDPRVLVVYLPLVMR